MKHRVEPPDWIDDAPIVFSNSLEIDAPVEAVWARIANHTGWTAWFTSLDDVEVTGAPSGIGGRRRVTVKRLSIDEEFTAWTENEQFAFAVTKSLFFFVDCLAEDVQLERVGGGCRVTYRQGIEAKRGWGWLAVLGFKQLPRQTADALANLKTLVEA